MDYYKKFVTKFKKDTEYHGAEAYAAAYVIADALKRAKSTKTADIKPALEKTDMMTVFGPVKFISYGKHKNQNKLPTYVVQWIDGKLEMVWPASLADQEVRVPGRLAEDLGVLMTAPRSRGAPVRKGRAARGGRPVPFRSALTAEAVFRKDARWRIPSNLGGRGSHRRHLQPHRDRHDPDHGRHGHHQPGPRPADDGGHVRGIPSV